MDDTPRSDVSAVSSLDEPVRRRVYDHVRAQASPVSRDDVADDGRGIEPEAQPGIGLTSMRERAAEVGGIVHVERASRGIVEAGLPEAFAAFLRTGGRIG